MQEFKLPKNKVWEKLSEDINKNFPTISAEAPTQAPPAIGLIYINTTTRDVYISVGKSNVSDWALMVQD